MRTLGWRAARTAWTLEAKLGASAGTRSAEEDHRFAFRLPRSEKWWVYLNRDCVAAGQCWGCSVSLLFVAPMAVACANRSDFSSQRWPVFVCPCIARNRFIRCTCFFIIKSEDQCSYAFCKKNSDVRNKQDRSEAEALAGSMAQSRASLVDLRPGEDLVIENFLKSVFKMKIAYGRASKSANLKKTVKTVKPILKSCNWV